MLFMFGVLKMFAMLGVWLCIESGIYGTAVGTSEETLHVAVLLLKTALKRFYRKHFRETGKQLTQVSDVTVKMVGSRNDPKLKTKGAESWGILLFLQDVFRTYGAAIRCDRDEFGVSAA